MPFIFAGLAIAILAMAQFDRTCDKHTPACRPPLVRVEKAAARKVWHVIHRGKKVTVAGQEKGAKP
jgi:hypothetical protein